MAGTYSVLFKQTFWVDSQESQASSKYFRVFTLKILIQIVRKSYLVKLNSLLGLLLPNTVVDLLLLNLSFFS